MRRFIFRESTRFTLDLREGVGGLAADMTDADLLRGDEGSCSTKFTSTGSTFTDFGAGELVLVEDLVVGVGVVAEDFAICIFREDAGLMPYARTDLPVEVTFPGVGTLRGVSL